MEVRCWFGFVYYYFQKIQNNLPNFIRFSKKEPDWAEEAISSSLEEKHFLLLERMTKLRKNKSERIFGFGPR